MSRALLCITTLIIVLAMAALPTVEARPKDKTGGTPRDVAAEPRPADEAAVTAESAEPPRPAPDGMGSSDERTLLALDADGDYIPDAFDNCPDVQNPDQADADGDGSGDACPVFVDMDGDGIPNPQDNCPNVGTADQTDSDGDGLGDVCDKSPFGVEPEPAPIPELPGSGGETEAAPPAPENGANQDGVAVEREGHDRAKQRERTSREPATITIGSDPEEPGSGSGAPPVEDVSEELTRDMPQPPEEPRAEAGASGEPDAPPESVPVLQSTGDEEEGLIAWEAVVRIDAGATDEAAPGQQAADERTDQGARGDSPTAGTRSRSEHAPEATDSRFARGWMRAKVLLQAERDGGEPDRAEPVQSVRVATTGQHPSGRVPVPVENGLVIVGNENALERDEDREGETNDGSAETGPVPERESLATAEPAHGHDDSRRNGSSRGAAATAPNRQPQSAESPTEESPARQDTRRPRRANRQGAVPDGWSNDRDFAGGAALDWSDTIDIAGTEEDALYRTQRSGSGPGQRRGFAYAIPVEESGPYLVRLHFAELYWGARGGPPGAGGRRIFSVTAEGETVLEDLDVFAEAGPGTALIKEFVVDIQDGEVNLRFTARAGAPMIAAIEVLRPAG